MLEEGRGAWAPPCGAPWAGLRRLDCSDSWLLGSSLRGPPVSSCGVNGLLIPGCPCSRHNDKGKGSSFFLDVSFVETKLRRTRAPPLRVPPGTARDRPTASPSATSLATQLPRPVRQRRNDRARGIGAASWALRHFVLLSVSPFPVSPFPPLPHAS